MHVEALLFGNLTAEDATALADAVCAALPGEPMPAAERPLEEVAALPEGSSLLVRRARRGQACAERARRGPGEAWLESSRGWWRRRRGRAARSLLGRSRGRQGEAQPGPPLYSMAQSQAACPTERSAGGA